MATLRRNMLRNRGFFSMRFEHSRTRRPTWDFFRIAFFMIRSAMFCSSSSSVPPGTRRAVSGAARTWIASPRWRANSPRVGPRRLAGWLLLLPAGARGSGTNSRAVPALGPDPFPQAQAPIAAVEGPDTVAGARFPGEAQSVARIDRLERSFRVVRRA